MKRYLASILAPCLLCMAALSCDPAPIAVEDNSFTFSSRHYLSGEENLISLSLEKGCPQCDYTLDYVIDSDPSLLLSRQGGAELPSGSAVSFKDGPVTLRLPALAEGEHKASFTLSTEDYSIGGELAFTVTFEPFALHAEVSAEQSAGTSTLLLSLKEGVMDRDYSGTVSIDGEMQKGMEFNVNFSKTPILSMAMPLIRPGTHEVEVDLRYGDRTRSCTFSFSEPLRHPDLDVEVARSPSTGKTRIMFRSNPYSLSVAVRDSLAVRGRCDYHRANNREGYIDKFTEWKDMCDVVELSRFVPETGRWYDLTATALLETTMTNCTIKNTKWVSEWIDAMDGIEQWWEVDDGYTNFVVVSSTHYLTVDFESLLGVRVNVTCPTETVVWNGEEIKEGSYSYTITKTNG